VSKYLTLIHLFGIRPFKSVYHKDLPKLKLLFANNQMIRRGFKRSVSAFGGLTWNRKKTKSANDAGTNRQFCWLNTKVENKF